MNDPFAIGDRMAKWYYIVFDSNPNGGWHRTVNTQSLSHDHVKIGKSVELLHRGVVRVNLEELFPKLVLDSFVLSQSVQGPGRSSTKVIRH